MKAPRLADSSSQILQSSIWHNSLGAPGVSSPVQALQLQAGTPTPEVRGAMQKSTRSSTLPQKHTLLGRERLQWRSLAWKACGNRLHSPVWCGLFGFSKYRRSHVLFAESHAHSGSPPPPRLLLYFSLMFFFSGTYFSFFTILSPSFSVLIMEGKFSDTQGVWSVEDGQEGPLSWLGPV